MAWLLLSPTSSTQSSHHTETHRHTLSPYSDQLPVCILPLCHTAQMPNVVLCIIYILYIMLLIAYIYIFTHIYMYIYNSRGLWKNKEVSWIELHGKHVKILAIKYSTPTSSSVITVDHQCMKGQLEVIHSRKAQRGIEVPMGSHSLICTSKPDILQK